MSKNTKSDTTQRSESPPSLKSASGSGFSFEDKVAALLFCEILAAKSSLGAEWGVIERVERQAGDWEPFGDLLLTAPSHDGKSIRCGCSVRSNRQINANGCNAELCAALWSLIAKQVFHREADMLGLFCAQLAKKNSELLHSLCRQARELAPARLDEKVTHANLRNIYDSFRNITITGADNLPGHVLAHLIPREFDFEDVTSRSEADAIKLCREILRSESATETRAQDLWKELLSIAEKLRVAGGETTREQLAAKLRTRFELRDDPSDLAAWEHIHAFSNEWIEQIETKLPGGLTLPRAGEMDALRRELATSRAFHVIGESGSGKSALLKMLAYEKAASGTEVVWIKADQFERVVERVPDFAKVLLRTRRASALLVFDALDACYSDALLIRIGREILALTADGESLWKIILVCQTPGWTRVSRCFVKGLAGHNALSRRIEVGDLSAEDMGLVYAASPSIRRLASQSHFRRLLTSPKMLDLLLNGELEENRPLAGEADLVDWWWKEQVMGAKQFSAEESIARKLAVRMANDLTSEVSPDAAEGPSDSVETLIKRRVLRCTQDGRLRFDHDLLADWSRVMHLRSLGDDVVVFMRDHAENPPWLRAIRLLSQHLLERASDLERWRSIVAACSIKTAERGEPSAADLQVLDAWLEGIAYCTNPERIFGSIRADLLIDDGRLLKRFVRRLLHTGTLPDPIIQQRFQRIDADLAEDAAMLFRLPQQILWKPVVEFLIANPNEATDYLPVELAEIAAMWARLEEYLQLPWSALAELVLLNGEKELRREIAGEYRRDRGSRSLGAGNKARVNIYTAALQAASQSPDRAAKLALKAAGRAPWEEGDVSGKADEGWRGDWHDRSFLGRGSTYVKSPPESWDEGPTRRVSGDFCHAWFESNAPLALYRILPNVACEATLAFLVDWPRAGIRHGHYEIDIGSHGFQFQANHMYPAFWTKGPFLPFLRQNWNPALELIISLVNFATDRYAECWSYEPGIADVGIATPKGDAYWKGNHQVFAWHRYHMNTPHVVTCALMALEKWFDEQMEANRSITDAIQLLYRQGRSLAFAGVLISIGKRYPQLFAEDLNPLLYVRELYMLDMQAVYSHIGGGYWPYDGKIVNNLRREWEQLPGRRTLLKDICCEWLLTRPEIAAILQAVCRTWRESAEKLPKNSEKRIVLLRWAANFDRSLWKEITLSDGRKGWTCERPEILRDIKGEEAQYRKEMLLILPFQCSELLRKRQSLNDGQLEEIWQQLQKQQLLNESAKEEIEIADQSAAKLLDQRHGRAGLLALLLCLGRNWLINNPKRRDWVKDEVRILSADPVKVLAYSPDDILDGCEDFLARCAVQCWVDSPTDPGWRCIVGRFVTAYRYRTLQNLFDEAFRLRAELREAYRELEALALSFAVARHEARKQSFLRTHGEADANVIRKWYNKWLPKFAKGNGPKWVSDWSTIEKHEAFPREQDAGSSSPRRYSQLRRRSYGLDMGTILAAFGHLPALARALDNIERVHWLNICIEMLRAVCRTLPAVGDLANNGQEWKYDVWSSDGNIFDIVARRIFECLRKERPELWQPILNLPPAAHHHISQFLNAVLLEALHMEASSISELVTIWREMAEYLVASKKWTTRHARGCREVWRIILLYGIPFTSTDREIFGSLVDALRPFFEQHVKAIARDAYELSSLAVFLTTKAGECLLVDALVWLRQSWEQASNNFWESVVERGHFERLLEHAWREKHSEIRMNPEAFEAFKVLTLNLASRHVPAAMEVQQYLGRKVG